MRKRQTVTRFELLPNETLIQCLEYLNGVDIFHSFDQLNYRFYKLIRSIPLYLDFSNTQRLSAFNQFCTKILSTFSLHEFSNLRSLTLGGISEDTVSQLKLVIPLLSQLSCVRLLNGEDKYNEILSILKISKIRTLTVPKLFSDNRFSYDISSIVNLTILACTKNELHQILNYGSRLKYLNLQNFYKYRRGETQNNKYSTEHHAIYVKQLIIAKMSVDFDDIVMILKQTPNLKSLTIRSDYNTDMIDADRWKHLITSSLPYLNIFKFKFDFDCYDKNRNDILHERWRQFQDDFWHKQHHWYTEYSTSNNSASIYTTPYISERFVLIPSTRRCYIKWMNHMNTFDNIRDLSIHPDAMTEQCEYHFSHVTSLELGESPSIISQDFLLYEEHIELLKTIVYLFNVKNLKIWSNCQLKTSSVLLEILKQAPQLSSISIDEYRLTSLFKNKELCNYLNKMIKNLNIWDSCDTSFNTSHKRKQFCKIFSNIEQLMCRIEQLDSLLFLLKRLRKLSYIKAALERSTSAYQINSFKKKVHKLRKRIIIDIESNDNIDLSIYIIRKAN